MSWRSVKLGEIATMKYGKLPPKETSGDKGFPIFTGYRISGFCDEYLYDQPEVIVVARGVGGTGDVKMSPEKSWITNLSIVLSVDADRIDKRFLFYRLGQEPLKEKLNTGAAQAQITIENLLPYTITIPIIATQRRIASILSAYDDLIDNNRQRMVLLEDAARQLYREWFVRLRFPGHEHTRITNGVPEGWEWKRIGNITDCVGGGTPSTSVSTYWEDGNITWITPTDVTRNKHFVLLDSEKKITEAGLKASSTKLVPAHAILMTSRASVGFFAITGREVCTNQGFISVVPQDPTLSSYLLFHLSERVEEIRSMSSGSTYPEVSRGKFREFEVLIPKYPLISAFNEQVTELMKQIRILKQQNEKLRAARDLLLPRLMNGEIAV